MNLEKFIIMIFVFTFTALGFPFLVTATEGVSPIEPLQPFIAVFPIIYLAFGIAFGAYYGLRSFSDD